MVILSVQDAQKFQMWPKMIRSAWNGRKTQHPLFALSRLKLIEKILAPSVVISAISKVIFLRWKLFVYAFCFTRDLKLWHLLRLALTRG